MWLYNKLVTTSTNWIGKNAVLFNIIGGGRGFLTQTSLRLAADALSCALPRVPHFGIDNKEVPGEALRS